MKLTLNRTPFQKALSHGHNVVERHHTIPILGHVLLCAKDNLLTLSTTDMDMSLVEAIPAKVTQPGQTTVSAALLSDIVRKLPDSTEIHLESNPQTSQLLLQSGRAKFNLSCLAPRDFPQLTESELTHTFQMPAKTLEHLLNRTRFAMSTEEARFYLNGIYFHTVEKEGQQLLRCVATDAHRLACADVHLPEGAQGMPNIIIGRKAINELVKLLSETDQDITIGVSKARIELQFPTAILSTRLIDGTFPDYEQVIPKGNSKRVIVPAQSLSAAVDRVATISNEKVRVIKLDLKENQLSLSANSQEMGTANEELDVDYDQPEALQIGFNPKYLMDVTQQITDDEAQILFGDGRTPAIIQGAKDPSSFYILMPILV